jgi:hypothetical protein
MYIKVDAPKNRGDFNDCLPYENLYIKPVFFKQCNRSDNYFFLVLSIFLAAVSIFAAAESIFLAAVSIAGIAALIESAVFAESIEVVAGVSVELLQAVKDAAIANTKSTFFIF